MGGGGCGFVVRDLYPEQAVLPMQITSVTAAADVLASGANFGTGVSWCVFSRMDSRLLPAASWLLVLGLGALVVLALRLSGPSVCAVLVEIPCTSFLMLPFAWAQVPWVVLPRLGLLGVCFSLVLPCGSCFLDLEVTWLVPWTVSCFPLGAFSP